MLKFFSISSLRDSINSYLKYDSYRNCKLDLCDFFKDQTIDVIFNNPILLAPSKTFRFIKSRIQNSNYNKGKSGGYRLYYCVDISSQNVYLLGYFPKTGKFGREDLTNTEEKIMINKFSSERTSNTLVLHNIYGDFNEITVG